MAYCQLRYIYGDHVSVLLPFIKLTPNHASLCLQNTNNFPKNLTMFRDKYDLKKMISRFSSLDVNSSKGRAYLFIASRNDYSGENHNEIL